MINIGKQKVGEGDPVFIIAELSANHLQRFDLAVESIKAIKRAGADAVKLQTYLPETITIDSDQENFRIKHGTLWDGKTLFELYQQAYTPWEWQPKIKKMADELGLICFSSPFDKSAVDFLEGMGVPAYKVASFEITDIPLIEYIASKGKPIIISTGVADYDEIKEAVNACLKTNNHQIALLKCTSAYPAPLDEMNLKTMPDLAAKFNTVVGLSDHTLGITAPVVATALGAKIIEKHFILEKKLGGPDCVFSLDAEEFKTMVKAVREAERAVGKVTYALSEGQKKSRDFIRSLFVVKDIKEGEVLTEENIKSIRPGQGLSPKYLNDLLGKKAKKTVKKGVPVSWDLIK